MFTKILKIIGAFFLVLIVIVLCAAIWVAISASEYTESAKPYLEKNIPAIVSWDFEKLRPLLSEEALKNFETERGQKVYRMFSKLGRLVSLEEPQFVSSKSGVTFEEGSFDIVNFSILGHFEAGDALLTISLAQEDEAYSIYYININSDVFLE